LPKWDLGQLDHLFGRGIVTRLVDCRSLKAIDHATLVVPTEAASATIPLLSR
jgi:hypothetical protein